MVMGNNNNCCTYIPYRIFKIGRNIVSYFWSIRNSANDNDIKIYIGEESEITDDVSVIKTKYDINGEEVTIAIMGPKRMEYGKVVAMLDYIKENIGGMNEKEK